MRFPILSHVNSILICEIINKTVISMRISQMGKLRLKRSNKLPKFIGQVTFMTWLMLHDF